MGLLNKFFKEKNKEQYVNRKYYKNYAEKVYVSEERDLKQWESMISMFPNMLVQKDKMVRDKDGLLPGHIYMLHWLNKSDSNRRVPVYFEYEYGIDFFKEKQYLQLKGLIFKDKPTKLGLSKIEENKEIIDEKENQNKIKPLDMKTELSRYRKEAKEAREYGIEMHESIEQRKGFVYQMNGISDYQNKNFDSAKEKLLKAMELGFYSPGGTEYLAKIYRKEKDYLSEIKILENSISNLKNENAMKQSQNNVLKLEERLAKAKILLDKSRK